MPVLEMTQGAKYVAARLDHDLFGSLTVTVLTGEGCRVKAMTRTVVDDMASGYAYLESVRIDAQSRGYREAASLIAIIE